MTKDKMVSIPLIKFSADLPRWPVEKNGPLWSSFPEIRVRGHEITAGCYGVEIEDESMNPVLKTGMAAVFSQNDSPQALENIFSIGVKGESPVVRKVVRNEIPGTGKNDALRPGRKSFMTPTPLHIPGSRVSPIADSTHQTIFLKALANPQKLILVPGGNVLWMHPMVLILKPGEF